MWKGNTEAHKSSWHWLAQPDFDWFLKPGLIEALV